MGVNVYLDALALKYPEFQKELGAGVLPEEIMDAEMEGTSKRMEGEESYDGIF